MRAYLPQIVKWGKLLGGTSIAQALIQGVGFVVGVFIIRILPTEEYAYYTLVNTMLGTMTVLADGGISSGVMAQGGNKWEDKEELGVILATGMHLRRQFAVGSLLVSVPVLFYLLREQDLGWLPSAFLIVCLIPAFLSALSGSLLQIVPRLHQDIRDLLRINLSINVLRLVLSIPALLLFPFAAAAVLSTGAAQVAGNLQFRKLAHRRAFWRSPPSRKYRRKILKTVRRILPSSIYYCVSGQITVWLLAFFGSTESVAQIGALSRLMMVLTLLKLVASMVIVPRYARLPPRRGPVVNRYFQLMGLLVLVSACIVGAVWLFPNFFLWILGNKYDDLEREVILMTAGSCLTMINGISYMMASSRGIVPNPYLFVVVSVVGQLAVLLLFVDYTSLIGVITFSVLSALIVFAFRVADFLYQTVYRHRYTATT